MSMTVTITIPVGVLHLVQEDPAAAAPPVQEAQPEVKPETVEETSQKLVDEIERSHLFPLRQWSRFKIGKETLLKTMSLI